MEGQCFSWTRESCEIPKKRRQCNLEVLEGCKVGVQICQDEGLTAMKWGDCRPLTPHPENSVKLCADGIDNDCDGKVDYNDEDCTCKPGQKEPCYTGDKKSRNKGNCSDGARTCTAKGEWGECEGQVLPQEETCNPQDDNCDGQVDEDLSNCKHTSCKESDTRACYLGKQGCVWNEQEKKYQCKGKCKAGFQRCGKDKVFEQGFCREEVVPQKETCNDQEDDCDGEVDEGLTRSCYSAVSGCNLQADGSHLCNGLCRAGRQSCASGRWEKCGGEVKPSTELCNGKDDDCDGQVDEALTQACYGAARETRGVGTCKEGTATCIQGELVHLRGFGAPRCRGLRWQGQRL